MANKLQALGAVLAISDRRDKQVRNTKPRQPKGCRGFLFTEHVAMTPSPFVKSPPWKRSHYAARNIVLKSMGFPSYAAYLASDLWKSIRRKVLTDGTECTGCFEQASEVHHLEYTTAALKGDDLTVLVCLCHACHRHIEFGRNRSKLTPTEAHYRLCKLIGKKRKTPTRRPISATDRCEAGQRG